MNVLDSAEDSFLDLKLPDLGQKLSHEECCHLAFVAALQGAGFVQSNPMVGAVALDKDSCFLGVGAHLKFGENHAEVNLLEGIIARGHGDLLSGATIYCTLEPCSFHGKTPPCCNALAAFPIAKLIYGQKDPNPKVNGAGIAYLRSKGISCVQDPVFMDKSKRLIEVFSWNQSRSMPYVALKAAISLDGKIGKKFEREQGEVDALSITGRRARMYGHWMRHCYDAIVVGANTVIADNPSLNVRHSSIKKVSEPIRIILDPNLRAASSLNISKLNLISRVKQSSEVVWVVDKECFQLHSKRDELESDFSAMGIRLLTCRLTKDSFVLNDLLTILYDLRINSILLEGGAGLWSRFLNAGAVNKIHLFQSPVILGEQFLSWSHQFLNPARIQVEDAKISSLGEDYVIEGELKY